MFTKEDLHDDHKEPLRVAIPLDTYKRGTFRKHLKAAGFEWSEGRGLVKGTRTFYVETKLVKTLFGVIQQANAEARKK